MTKNETRDILHSLDVQWVREQVFQLLYLAPAGRSTADVPVSEQLLLQVYFAFIGDAQFVDDIRQAKQSHERFMLAILTCEVFPKLEKCNPLASVEEDVIPEKYGPKWLNHQNLS